MSVIAGLQDFRKEGPPADIGTFQLPCSVLVFQHTFAGTTYVCALRAGERAWVPVDYGIVVSTVINNALGALTVGRTWKEEVILKGYFTIAAQINVPSHTFIEIQGCVRLANGSSTTINMFYLADYTDIVIVCGEIDGNKANQADGGNDEYQNGIKGFNASDVLIDEIYIHDCVYNGVLFSHVVLPPDTGASRVIVSHNRINDCGWDGVHFHLGTYSIIDNNIITGSVTRNGIVTFSGSKDVITDNIIFGIAGTNGIMLQTSTDTVISGNVVHDANQNGIRLYTSSNNTLTGNICYLNSQRGICLNPTSSNNTLTGNTCQENKWDGIGIIDSSNNNTLVGNTCQENEGSGISITANADDNLVISNTCNLNGAWGIRIIDANCERNWVKNNQLRGNTSGPFTDGGTDTKLASKTFQFTELLGGAAWQVASPAGIVVDAAGEGGLALGWADLEVQQVVKFRVAGVALAAPGAGKGMLLEININAGKPTGHEAYNAEAITCAGVISTEDNMAINDAIEWVITATDDADIGHIEFGETIEIFALYEADGADNDIATNIVLRTVTMEYV